MIIAVVVVVVVVRWRKTRMEQTRAATSCSR
jgi:hypothetical protein